MYRRGKTLLISHLFLFFSFVFSVEIPEHALALVEAVAGAQPL